jgi:hypothetical protein
MKKTGKITAQSLKLKWLRKQNHKRNSKQIRHSSQKPYRMEKTILRLVFDKSSVVKEYKQEIENLKEEN